MPLPPRPVRPMNLGLALLDCADRLPTIFSEPVPSADTEALASDCLSEDDLLGFAAGQLKSHEIQHIDEHLARCSLCARVITDVLGELTPPSAAHPLLVPCVFPPATKVAQRFVIERLIGRGGMGEVYAALDLQSGQVVAIKTVLAERCDSRRAMSHLVGELDAARAIEHPNVCRARGMGVHVDDGAPGTACRFIVMDYIDGETLGARYRREGALPRGQALSVARQILLGLQAIHAAGIVHLDVKSDNVMLRASRAPHAILIDFGLARPARPDRSEPERNRSPCGTVSYMAPEQLLRQPLGPHTDVFGFGVVMYELLTGAHPFCERPASALGDRDRLETRALRENELPIRPARLFEGLPARLDDFVAICTQPDPQRRFADATTALRFLDSLVS